MEVSFARISRVASYAFVQMCILIIFMTNAGSCSQMFFRWGIRNVNYILGFDESLRADVLREGAAHFVCADATAAAKEGKLAELVKKYFG